MLFDQHIEERELNGGIQRLYRFPNNYGASVVKHSFSYGARAGLWELAVIQYSGPGHHDYSLIYSTPITDDVLGHLSQNDVEKVLSEIRELS